MIISIIKEGKVMKQTKQKQAVLDTVKNMKNHPTADEVHKEISKTDVGVGIATVYRNLNAFASQGLIKKVVIPNSSDRFDYRLDKHEHFLCEKCGKVLDVDVSISIGTPKDKINYTNYALTLFGICDDCAS